MSGGILHAAIYQHQVQKLVLVAKEQFPIEELSVENRKKAFSALMNQGRGHIPVTHLVARDKSFIKQFEFPSRNMEEIKQMVALRLPREVPFSLDQITYHIHPVRFLSESDVQTSVFLFGITKEMIAQERAVLQTFGIDPKQFVLTSVVLARYVHKQIGTTGTAPKLVIFSERGKGEVAIVSDQSVAVSRTFQYDPDDISTSIPEALQPIIDALNHKEDTSNYDLCLGGDIKSIKNEIFSGSYPNRVNLGGDEAGGGAQQLLMMAAEAYDGTYEEFNLLPDEDKSRIASADTKRHGYALRFAVILFLGLAAAASFYRSARILIAGQAIQRELKKIEPSIRETKATVRLIQTLYYIEKGKVEPMDLLASIHEQAPDGVLLSEMEYDGKDDFVRIKGKTSNQALVDQFVRQLSQISWLARVDLQYSESAAQSLSPEFQFSIQGVLSKEGMYTS